MCVSELGTAAISVRILSVAYGGGLSGVVVLIRGGNLRAVGSNPTDASFLI